MCDIIDQAKKILMINIIKGIHLSFENETEEKIDVIAKQGNKRFNLEVRIPYPVDFDHYRGACYHIERGLTQA